MFNNGLSLYPYKQLGFFEALKSKINLGAILTNTQKTLNIVNQAIPIVYQVKPIVNNAKTLFKVIGAVNAKDPTPTTKIINTNTPITKNETTLDVISNQNQPTFFL